MPSTMGTLLGGRVHYTQPAAGFRSGIEPVLLAAAIPVRAGQRVLEAGSGAGAGLLCLAARVQGITGVGVEIDPTLADLASGNAAANGHADLRFIAGDITVAPSLAPLLAPGLAPFDHAFANPPYHPASGTASPHAARAGAKMAATGLFAAWIGAMARPLKHRGTLSLIIPVNAVPACLAALAQAGCGSCYLFPLWPRVGRPAKLAILQAVRGGRGPFQVLPGLTLHNGAGFSAPADAVLRHARALDIGSPKPGSSKPQLGLLPQA